MRGAPIGNQRGLKHGMYGTPEYRAWDSMIQRCRGKTKPGYKNYGGRGITVCDRWKKFEQFFADMGIRPSVKHSVDRIDNNGNYTPANCRWATQHEQGRNKRNNRIVEYNGKEYCLIDLANKFDLNFDTLSDRLNKGWSIEKALEQPKKTLITYKGESKRMVDWAKDYNMDPHILYQRIMLRKWSVEKSLTIPVRQHRLLITHNGETKTLKDWSKQNNVSTDVLGRRFRAGWSAERALNTPVRPIKLRKKVA